MPVASAACASDPPPLAGLAVEPLLKHMHLRGRASFSLHLADNIYIACTLAHSSVPTPQIPSEQQPRTHALADTPHAVTGNCIRLTCVQLCQKTPGSRSVFADCAVIACSVIANCGTLRSSERTASSRADAAVHAGLEGARGGGPGERAPTAGGVAARMCQRELHRGLRPHGDVPRGGGHPQARLGHARLRAPPPQVLSPLPLPAQQSRTEFPYCASC